MDSSLESQKKLKKNLKLLQNIHPLWAYQLTMTDPSDLEFCWTKHQELNLKRLYQNQTYYYHSPVHALQEAHEWFQALELSSTTLLFVYGIGLGYYYEAAQPWLKQHPQHILIFLEEDLGVLHRLCETERGTQILKDPQVQLVYRHDHQMDKTIFNELSWTYFKSPFIISCLKLYGEVHPEGYAQLHHQLSHALIEKKAWVQEYQDYGIAFFRNFYPNLLDLPHAYWGNGLFDRFPQIPAIICGAGPSLHKNMHLLSFLKERALIFAGGTALNALLPEGIRPHFGVAIDPNKEQQARLTIAQYDSLPFFYRSRLFHKALKQIKGPHLYLTGAGGYETAHWFEKHLQIEGKDLDEGHNVVNFSLQIAQALGCNPIILIGVDLAFNDQQFYAEGIASHLNLAEEDLKAEASSDSAPLLQKDIEGKPIYTLWKWITEAEWIAEFAQIHPEITILNATEGGLGFKGIANLTLQEAAQQFLQNPKEEIQHLDQEIAKHSLHLIQTEHIVSLFQEMQASLDHCVFLLNQLIEESECLVKQIREGNPFPDDLQTPTLSLLESDLETEVGYVYLLDRFNQVYARIQQREWQDAQSLKHRLSPKKRALKKIELHKQRLNFLREVAQLNRQLIQKNL